MIETVGQIVDDFAEAMRRVDALGPQAHNQRSRTPYQPGLGPHSESDTVRLVAASLAATKPDEYGDYGLDVPYPGRSHMRCDWCFGKAEPWLWAVEVKMLRFLGDNGKANDNMLMHILSPYSQHRSALTDCKKLIASELASRRVILIYGFDSEQWPLDPAIGAFEVLAQQRVKVSRRQTASVTGLIHPVHSSGAVFGWELL